MSPHSAQDFFPRADLEAQITASPSPVTSAKDARSWLKNKGWILSSEDSSSAKLFDILLAATLSFKLPADACTAIRAVAFLLQAQTNGSTAATIADGVIDKVINKINSPLAKLNEHIDATKSFLDAAAQKQAAELLSLQEAVKQQAGLINSLTAASEKAAAQAPNPRGLSDTAWPQLTASGPLGHPRITTGPMPPQGLPMTDPKVPLLQGNSLSTTAL